MKLEITHSTHYDYAPAVEIAQHVACLQPPTTACQQLLDYQLGITPEPAHRSCVQDVYGNMRQFFSLQSPHRQLTVVAHSVVNTQSSLAPQSTVPWEVVRERFRYAAQTPYDAAAEFVFASPFVPRHPDFAAYARPSFEADRPLVACARDLMHRIYRDFTYDSQSTQINTPALQALAQRKGVCQDFAHIMVAALRSLGLSARYVSGYLLTQPLPGQERLVGSDASHAWVSVYVPDWPADQRWLDLDPTNDRDGWGSPGEDYVTLAIGRDYADVSPIRGVIHGGAQHTLSVGVTVAPVTDGLAPIAQQRQNSDNVPEPSPDQGQVQSQSMR